jgi:glycosyltransferase involved in cell wall biosynthesis
MFVVDTHTSQAKYFKFDVLHIHWPEFYVTLKPFYIALVLAPSILLYMIVTKLLHKKIVWTVHDVTPARVRHSRLLHLYLFCVRVLVDAYVFISPSSEAEFKQKFPQARKKPAWHVPHGPYPVSATSPECLAEMRERLSGGANCLLVGFLGDIRPYKNPEVLAYLPRQDSIGREVKVVVAGVADPGDPAADLLEIEVSLSRVPLRQLVRIRERLTDNRLADMIRAVDVVFLPYLRGSNSGFGMLVLSCGQRLLCSALPMFRDLTNCLGPPWVYVFDHRAKDLCAELEAALFRFQHDVVDRDATSRLRAFLDDCSFDHGAQQLRVLYERLIN